MMNEKSYESPSSFKTILIYIVLFQIANHAAIFHVSSFTLVPSWRIQKIDTRAGEAFPSKQSSGKTSTALNGIRGFRAWVRIFLLDIPFSILVIYFWPNIVNLYIKIMISIV